MMRQEMRKNCAGLARGRDEKKKTSTHPEGEGCAILGELEADEAVYEEARICSSDQPRVYRGKPRINDVRGGYDARVEEDGEEFDEGVQPEEGYNLFAA
jgi:hypothetical protein